MATIIDPSHMLGLVAKYKKALEQGKLATIRLEFTNGEFCASASVEGEDFIPLGEAMASIKKSSKEERPFVDEKAHAVSKFEARLDKEAPEGLRNASSMEDISAAIAALPFKERRAFQMSNREFDLAFLRWEDGAPIPRPVEQAEEMRAKALLKPSSKRGGKAPIRGRGRGGRGRGSFRAPQSG